MTLDEFIQLLNNPESVTASHIPDLKEMILYYPYFTQAKVLLAKALYQSESLHAEHYVAQASLAVADRRSFYYYLYPDKKINSEPLRTERIPRFGGNYFDILNAVEAEGSDTKQSLKNLAERLKSARAMISQEDNTPTKNTTEIVTTPVRVSTPEYFQLQMSEGANTEIVSEEQAKKLIKEKKYHEAIAILNKLNLINPKKSIYFADQIRFLEKILVNSKKQT